MIERLPPADWVTLSQAGLEPIVEGRFVVHTAAHPLAAPPGGRAFLIEAGRAFGTGHHATTSGCLAMLDALAGQEFAKVIDIGTGTGLLAFAATHLWPEAAVRRDRHRPGGDRRDARECRAQRRGRHRPDRRGRHARRAHHRRRAL